jgi:hypothetical protein
MVRSGKSKFKAHYQSGNFQTGNGLLFFEDLRVLILNRIPRPLDGEREG